MSGLQKVLVVDNGRRLPDSGLSFELAEMGFASVTTPLEAADEVLASIKSPVAIVVHVPPLASPDERKRYMALVERLEAMGSTPVIVMRGRESQIGTLAGRFSALVTSAQSA
jgi:hypothetical protein